ncbi:MAG: hypothetical protein AABX60_02770, partial [Nanoarchaeota archaeon]
MADGKRGFLQGILQGIPLIGAKKEGGESGEVIPAKGAVPVYIPRAYKHETRMGWFPHRIKYRGMFDLDGFYKTMALWFKERRFELHERLYKAKP